MSNRENVLECYGETRRQSSYDFFKSNFCLQNIKQHRIFRSVVLFCPLILSGSGKLIGSFHFLFTFRLKHPSHAKNTPKTTDQFLLWNIVRAWTHFFLEIFKKTQESTSWNATVKPQNNQAELFYLKVCKEVKLASVFNLFKIEKFAVKLSSNILLRIGLWGPPPREAPVVSQNDIM